MPTISLFEHQSIFVGDSFKDISRLTDVIFESTHYNALANRLGKNDEEAFPFYSLAKDRGRDGIRFKQYVGVIQTKNLTIEILPKTDKGDEKAQYWKKILLTMLCQVYNLNIRSIDQTSQRLRKSSILDLFILRFLDETDRLIHTGLIKAYRMEDENLSTLKGKLILSKHFAKNAFHRERFFVRHTVYDQGHIMNRILRQTLSCISGSSVSTFLQQRAANCLAFFPELDPVTVTEDLFSRLVYDRKSEDYREAMTLAQLILFNNMPDLSSGKYETMAMLFDMNRLWEQFVYVTLRKYLPDYTVKDQVRRDFWESPLRIIKPDIVIRNDNDLYILDTKWKVPRNSSPSDADLHQMYVYYKYFDAKGVALVYPDAEHRTDPVVPGSFTDDTVGGPIKTASCDMMFLPVPDDGFKVRAWQDEIVGVVQDWLKRVEGLFTGIPLTQ